MHAEERERLILSALGPLGFVTYKDLEGQLDASPATIRRDLARLEEQGQIQRVRGGAKLPDNAGGERTGHLVSTPFEKSITQNLPAKRAIGKAAAELCRPGEGIMIDGGTTTLQMCSHLSGMGMQVLTNSLHIVDALLQQPDTRVLVPSGTVFREQNIILAPAGEESMPRFFAPKLFMGAAAIGPQGVMQADVVLVAAERRLIDRADEVILLVDSSKFSSSSGAIVCELDEIDVVITDQSPGSVLEEQFEQAGIRLIVAGPIT